MKSLKLVSAIILVASMFLVSVNASAQQRGRGGRSHYNERNDQYQNRDDDRRNDRDDVYENRNRNQYQNRGHQQHYGNRGGCGQRYYAQNSCRQNSCNHRRFRRMPPMHRMVPRRPRVHIQF